MKVNSNKFREFLKLFSKSEGISYTEIADKMGMRLNNFSNKINSKNVKAEIVLEFGKLYDQDVSEFFIYDVNDEITQKNEVSEMIPFYEIDTIKSRISEIENQFDTILKSQTLTKNVLHSAIEFLNVQTSNVVILKKLIGV